jgi:hypothetical protein
MPKRSLGKALLLRPHARDIIIKIIAVTLLYNQNYNKNNNKKRIV